MAKASLLDFGFFQKPSTGGAVTRIDRAGMRHKVEFSFPPMPAETARTFINRIERAKSEGLRIPFLLMGVDQSGGGTPAVNGSGAAGTSLPIKSLTAGFVIREGFWLSVVDSSGIYYLHQVTADVTASGGGTATASVWPPLRAPLADGNTVLITEPLVEGIVTGDFSWTQPVDGLVELGFTLEEAA